MAGCCSSDSSASGAWPIDAADRSATGALENLLFRRRRTIPAAFALLTLAMGWRAAGLRVDAGFTKPVPVKHEYMETFLQYRDEFGGADRVLIAVMARDDEYGGPTARRVRYHTEIVAAVKRALDGRAPFGIRISETKVNDLAHSWAGGADDARTIFGAIGEAGPSYIHVNAHRGFEPVFGTGKSLARLAREAAPRDVRIVACGKLNDPLLAEALIEDGTADAAAIAKGALADPGWPAKIARGEAPVAFDPAMLRPYATLENVSEWRAGKGPG